MFVDPQHFDHIDYRVDILLRYDVRFCVPCACVGDYDEGMLVATDLAYCKIDLYLVIECFIDVSEGYFFELRGRPFFVHTSQAASTLSIASSSFSVNIPAFLQRPLTSSGGACVKRWICFENSAGERFDLRFRLDIREDGFVFGCTVTAIRSLLFCMSNGSAAMYVLKTLGLLSVGLLILTYLFRRMLNVSEYSRTSSPSTNGELPSTSSNVKEVGRLCISMIVIVQLHITGLG